MNHSPRGVLRIFCLVGFGGAFWVCFGVWFYLFCFGFAQKRNKVNWKGIWKVKEWSISNMEQTVQPTVQYQALKANKIRYITEKTSRYRGTQNPRFLDQNLTGFSFDRVKSLKCSRPSSFLAATAMGTMVQPLKSGDNAESTNQSNKIFLPMWSCFVNLNSLNIP